MKKTLLSLFLFLVPLAQAFSGEVVIDGIKYYLVSKVKTAEVRANSYSGEVFIPKTVEHEGVTYRVTTIGNSAFSGCSGLTSVNIPENVTTIGNSAFNGCGGLTSVTIPVSVTTIGTWAFLNCSGLTSVHIYDLAAWCNINFSTSPFDTGHHLYLDGEEIKNLVIPASVTTINTEVFAYCNGLTSVTIPDGVTTIGDDAFVGCSGLTSVTIPESVTTIGEGAFARCSGLTSVTIPESVTTIGSAAFRDCSGLTSVTIPESVTTINDIAFFGCSGLTSVTIPESVTSINRYAFAYCSGLTSVTIPESVTAIDRYAFSNCNGLTSATIGSNVRYIYEQAFANCLELTDVYCLAEAVPWTSSDAFSGSYIEGATLHVPLGSLEDYTIATPWKYFGTKVSEGFYELKVTTTGKGTVSYMGQEVTAASANFIVTEGGNATLTFTPASDYVLYALTVNGADALAQVTNNELTLSYIHANTTVVAEFASEPKSEVTIKMAVANGDRTAIGYSSAYGLDFTNVSEVKAWIVTGYTDEAVVLLSRVRVVPPYTGLYLTSDVAGVEMDVPTTTQDVWYANLLLPAVEEEIITPTEIRGGEEYTNFVVGRLDSGEMGFVRVKQPRTLGPNKSRLLVPSRYYTLPAQARDMLRVVFIDEQASGIDSTAVNPTREAYYDLQGRCVDRPTRGLYIRGGKKYIIK